MSCVSCELMCTNIYPENSKFFNKTAEQMLVKYLTTQTDSLESVISGNEALIYGNDIETKAQSFQWKFSAKPNLKKEHRFDLW